MTGIPEEWRAYARLQEKLLNSAKLDEASWGTEAALDRIVDANEALQTIGREEICRAAATARRRERYRASRRALYLVIDRGPYAEDGLEAFAELSIAKDRVGEDNWALLRDVAFGHEYQALAVSRDAPPGALRVRVMRLRRLLLAA